MAGGGALVGIGSYAKSLHYRHLNSFIVSALCFTLYVGHSKIGGPNVLQFWNDPHTDHFLKNIIMQNLKTNSA